MQKAGLYIRSNALMGWGRWSWAWLGVVWDVLMGGYFDVLLWLSAFSRLLRDGVVVLIRRVWRVA